MPQSQQLLQLRAGQLSGVKRLDISCGLTAFPTEIFDLADSLEVLNLSGNALSSLPNDFARLKKLKILFCSNNAFTEIPEVLGQCESLSMIGFKANKVSVLPENSLPKNLQWLILTDNQLTHLPSTIGQCAHLQKLMLAGNQLSNLPNSMADCTQLELLRISANRFESLPDWLLSMPRLAWLAYAGNPFCQSLEQKKSSQQPATQIDWANLTIKKQLGEGASGVIYQAGWQRSDAEAKTIAVKLFKGAVTSDGLPQNEMSACIAAGTHPNLTTIEGAICNHPDHIQGLGMALIEPNFINLAHPPSFATCTRDVYATDTTFTFNQLMNIADGIASAAQHLHANHILHGDLYAHNILHNAQGQCLLSDFGAASFITDDLNGQAELLQKIEVRAYACLLEELIERCESPTPAIAALKSLQQDCAQANINARPLFSNITATLRALS